MSEKIKAHVAEHKKEKVAELVGYMKKYPIIASINMENVPAKQLQKMRANIRDMVVFKMAKRRFISIAIDQVKDEKKGLEQLKDHLAGMPALMFTKDNPFKLAKILAKSRSPAPAKAGQIAPKDIVVEAGPTPFAPGPIIGELGAIGIKSQIENGKVAIKSDSVVVKKGAEIKANVASILTRLDIQPMEIGLDLTAAYEDGIIFTKDILEVDEKEYLNKITSGHQEAFNLAVEIGYPTKEVLEFTIPKLHNEARALSLEAGFITDDTRDDILAKAEAQANALVSEANIDLTAKAEEAKEEVKEGEQ